MGKRYTIHAEKAEKDSDDNVVVVRDEHVTVSSKVRDEIVNILEGKGYDVSVDTADVEPGTYAPMAEGGAVIHEWRPTGTFYGSEAEAQEAAERSIIHARVGEYAEGLKAWPIEIWTGPPNTYPMQEGGVVENGEPGFYVIENTPGYMPDSEPADFEDYQSAVSYANELADELEEDGYETDRSVASRDNYYAISASRPNEPHDLGRVIEVVRAEPMQRGGMVENVGPGVPAIVGEAGPEAVIPLDDPAAVAVMAEAIEEGGGSENGSAAVEAAAEAVEAAAEAVSVVATAEALSDVAESETEAVEAVAEAEASIADDATHEAQTDAVVEAVEVVEDSSPEASHWFFRRMARR